MYSFYEDQSARDSSLQLDYRPSIHKYVYYSVYINMILYINIMCLP